MSTADSGTWKLAIYPIVILLVVGIILNLAMTPFLDAGIYPDNANQTEINAFTDVVTTGLEISVDIPILGTWTPVIPSPIQLLPSFMQDFIVTQITILGYIPAIILVPLLIIGAVAIIYLLWALIGMWIP